MKEYGDAQGWPHEGGPLFLHPDDDLAPNRPGEALHARLAALGVPRHPRLAACARALGRLAGRPDQRAALRRALDGEQRVGEELERLTGGGWRVLHSVPVPPAAAVPHLLIGPGGVFTLHTACRRGARVRVGTDAVLVARGRAEPWVRLSRREARHAALALSRGCGFPVTVQAVLALVGTAGFAVAPELADVLVVSDRQIAGLGAGRAVLGPAEVARVYAVARDRRTWLAL
ncbi:nuclease-related domain-containing protein [Streptomyces sp. NPDC054796]